VLVATISGLLAASTVLVLVRFGVIATPSDAKAKRRIEHCRDVRTRFEVREWSLRRDKDEAMRRYNAEHVVESLDYDDVAKCIDRPVQLPKLQLCGTYDFECKADVAHDVADARHQQWTGVTCQRYIVDDIGVVVRDHIE